jgi:hypothetical protein
MGQLTRKEAPPSRRGGENIYAGRGSRQPGKVLTLSTTPQCRWPVRDGRVAGGGTILPGSRFLDRPHFQQLDR